MKKQYGHKGLFTLIELIVSVVVLSILAAIVIPSVKDFQKEGTISALNSNIRILQTAVDSYSLRNEGAYPSGVQPTLERPQLIEIDWLYSDYIKSKPDYEKVKGQRYWVDSEGRVWGATVNAPSNLFKSEQFVEWVSDKDVKGYNLYRVEKNPVSGKVSLKKMKMTKSFPLDEVSDRIQIDTPEHDFLLSTIDTYGLETAPVGLTQTSYQDGFTPLLRKTGTFYFEMTRKEVMHWLRFVTVEDKPDGSQINYSFSVMNEDGAYGEYQSDFDSLPSAKGIKVKIEMIGNNGKEPSVKDLRVFYRLGDEEEALEETEFEVTLENLAESGVFIDPLKEAQVVSEFVVPEDRQVKEIVAINPPPEEGIAPPEVRYEYKEPSSSVFKEVTTFKELTEGTIVRVIQTYEPGEVVQPVVPHVLLKETVKTVKPVVGEIPVVEAPVEESEWTTIDTSTFSAHADVGEKVQWSRAIISDDQPEHTRILYTFATSDGGLWSEESETIETTVPAQSIRLTAVLQVKTSQLKTGVEPSVLSVKLESDELLARPYTPTTPSAPVHVGAVSLADGHYLKRVQLEGDMLTMHIEDGSDNYLIDYSISKDDFFNKVPTFDPIGDSDFEHIRTERFDFISKVYTGPYTKIDVNSTAPQDIMTATDVIERASGVVKTRYGLISSREVFDNERLNRYYAIAVSEVPVDPGYYHIAQYTMDALFMNYGKLYFQHTKVYQDTGQNVFGNYLGGKVYEGAFTTYNGHIHQDKAQNAYVLVQESQPDGKVRFFMDKFTKAGKSTPVESKYVTEATISGGNKAFSSTEDGKGRVWIFYEEGSSKKSTSLNYIVLDTDLSVHQGPTRIVGDLNPASTSKTQPLAFTKPDGSIKLFYLDGGKLSSIDFGR